MTTRNISFKMMRGSLILYRKYVFSKVISMSVRTVKHRVHDVQQFLDKPTRLCVQVWGFYCPGQCFRGTSKVAFNVVYRSSTVVFLKNLPSTCFLIVWRLRQHPKVITPPLLNVYVYGSTAEAHETTSHACVGVDFKLVDKHVGSRDNQGNFEGKKSNGV